MCEPVTAIMVAGAAIQAGGAVASHMAQNKASDENRKMADEAAVNDISALNARENEERAASVQSIMGIEREVRRQGALASVAAGEAGVSGASVNALLDVIYAEGAEATGTVERNFASTREQIEREKLAVSNTRTSRINSVPRASGLKTGLSIAGAALDAGTSIYGNRPSKGGR